MKKFAVVAVSALITVSAVSQSHAIGGLGFHWGLDFSLDMKGVDRDVLSVPGGMGFDMNTVDPGKLGYPDGLPFELPPVAIPAGAAEIDYMYVSRTNWRSSPINFGGKFFLDFFPVINIIELSFNFGVWQYDGAVHHLDIDALNEFVMANPGELPDEYDYIEVPMTVKEQLDKSYFGLTGTPYAKLQFDATLKRNLWELSTLKLNAGAGFSVAFTTPLLGSHLVNDLQLDKGYSPEELIADFMNEDSDIGKEIVEKIIKELMTPRYGMHLVAGVNYKIPIMPLGFYADAKFMIPFSKYDENNHINALGFLLNFGIALQI